jgi:hypothetical protein
MESSPGLSPSLQHMEGVHGCICRCNGLNEIPRARFPSERAAVQHACAVLCVSSQGCAATRTLSIFTALPSLSISLPPSSSEREREDDPICYSSQPEMVALECMHGGSHGFSLVLPEVLVEWWSRREKRNSESESTEVVGWER